MRVSVIGGGRVVPDDAAYATAREIGRRCGQRGHDVVCGGRAGVMEAACRGVQEGRADPATRTIGILPGPDPTAANDYVDTPVATGLGNARNVLVALNGDAVIAIDGGTGTLSELGHALDVRRPVAAIDGPDLAAFDGCEACETPAEALASVERRV
jgi:uncharacterized protein (TIGR00725 family)